QALRIGAVRDDSAHLDAGAGLDQRPHVAAPTRNQQDRRFRGGGHTTTTCGPFASRAVIAPISQASTPEAASVSSAALTSPLPTTSAMPMPQLNVRCIS